MSLIKLAVLLSLTPGGIATTTSSLLPFGFSVRAAKSGDPFKYVFSKTKGIIRPRIQKATLAGLANMEANMRKGMVQDSTKWRGALLDAQLGQFGKLGGKALEDIHTKKTPVNMMIKSILDKTITNEGKYNIENIEKLLTKGNKIYSKLDEFQKLPIARTSLIGGAAIGYAVGDNDHKLKSTLKGGFVGGALGGSLRKGTNFLHEEGKMIPTMHKEYFADNYWKSQLESSNKWHYQKVGKGIANAFTAFPKDRAKRIASSDKLQAFGDKFWDWANSGPLGTKIW
jgi:hypothetical protein